MMTSYSSDWIHRSHRNVREIRVRLGPDFFGKVESQNDREACGPGIASKGEAQQKVLKDGALSLLRARLNQPELHHAWRHVNESVA